MTGDELRDWRTRSNFYQRQVVDLLAQKGVEISTRDISSWERGEKEIPTNVVEILQGFQAQEAAGAPPPAPPPPDTEPPPPDAPPRPVDPPKDDEETLQRERETKERGKSGPIAVTLEAKLLALLRGEDLIIETRAPDGKKAREIVHYPGLVDFVRMLDDVDAQIIDVSAPNIAAAWAGLARVNPRVRAFLEIATTGGPYRQVVIATATPLIMIAMRHNWLPSLADTMSYASGNGHAAEPGPEPAPTSRTAPPGGAGWPPTGTGPSGVG